MVRDLLVVLMHMWHDQGKWVTCRRFQFLFSYTIVSQLQNASFWCKPHYNWICGYRVMQDLTMLKTISNKRIWTLFLPISQNQYNQHPTHSSWSCHIIIFVVFWLVKVKRINTKIKRFNVTILPTGTVTGEFGLVCVAFCYISGTFENWWLSCRIK